MTAAGNSCDHEHRDHETENQASSPRGALTWMHALTVIRHGGMGEWDRTYVEKGHSARRCMVNAVIGM